MGVFSRQYYWVNVCHISYKKFPSVFAWGSAERYCSSSVEHEYTTNKQTLDKRTLHI